MDHAVLNQKGEVVLSMISRMMVELRDAPGGTSGDA
jgi:hypothetical protein